MSLRFGGSLLTQLPRHFRTTLNRSQCRSFFGLPSALNELAKSLSCKEYKEQRVLGYSQQQLYDVVSNVNDYHKFLPWCTESTVFTSRPQHAHFGERKVMEAELVVGFQAFNERYTSEVTCDNPTQVRAIGSNSILFKHLENRWVFTPITTQKQTPKGSLCQLDFYVNFEFASPIHAQVSNLFFDQVSSLMIKAFEERCQQLYGPPTQVPYELQGKR
ncbi:hypothetical protein K7432_003898 [Basidiobolus ranarum]|uniref:Coenzyme Q-binding protein COQ10 START domain-containing protein n=1 Tax=Basidiobolus ranarum TaxID=34480 RepID=A0ABR2W6G1_9FUNG